MGNNTFFFQLFHSKSWNFCRNHRRFVWGIIFLLIILIGGYRLYRYYNRLKLIDRLEYKSDVFELYRDWSKSTHYYMRLSERVNAENYYVIKKNGAVYFKYKHNYSFAVSYRAFYLEMVEQDSLVLVQGAIDDMHGTVFLKMPLNKDRITKKDVRIIAIYPGILKDGSKRSPGDTTHYLLEDYKKVPKEVINYDHVISDY